MEKRIVIKVGSNVLTRKDGKLDVTRMSAIVDQIAWLRRQGYEVIPHPVNQPGSSKRQLSDLDLKLNGDFFIGTELKDKPFDESDVRHAARTAAEGGLKSIVFVSGRSGNLSAQTRAYFNEVRGEFASKGVYVGLVDIDALMDIVLASHHDIDVPAALTAVYDQVMNNAGTPETQRWVYYRLVELK